MRRIISALGKRFETASLRARLVLIISICSLASLGTGVTLLVNNAIDVFRSDSRQSVAALASVVSEFSVAPLSFADPAGAAEVLKRMSALPLIETAAVYNLRGERFAQYVRSAAVPEPPALQSEIASRLSGEYLDILQPVMFRGQPFGMLYLRASTAGLEKEIFRYVTTVILITLLALGLGILLALRLARVISGPILNLRKAVQEVSGKGDYSLRIRGEGSEEISELYAAFNHMLEQIELRQEQRARAEEMLRQSEKQIEHSHRLQTIGNLAGGIAHDLNNILSPMMSCIELADTEAADNAKIRSLMDTARKGSERARDLVEQILTFSRGSQVARRPLVLADLLRQTVKLLQASMPPGIEIKTELGADSGLVLASQTEINQLIMNLCTNAFQAMIPQGGVMGISVRSIVLRGSSIPQGSSLSAGKYLEIVVSDTGCGMDSSILARIYEPFFTTRALGSGTGLGLSVVHGIVKSLSGHIGVVSQPGRGTTFTVLLRASERQAVQDAEPLSAPIGGSGHILFVDDEEQIREIGAEVLESLGYTADVYADGRQALESLRARPKSYDLVITDQTMPAMPGTEFARLAHSVREDMPIILASGYSLEDLPEDECRRLGIVSRLRKPYSMKELADAIQQAFKPALKEES